jgi:hypothetical protein
MKIKEKIYQYVKGKALLYGFKIVRIKYISKHKYSSDYLCNFIKQLFIINYIGPKITFLLLSEIEKDLKGYTIIERVLYFEGIKGFTPKFEGVKELRIEYLEFKIQQYGNKTKNK